MIIFFHVFVQLSRLGYSGSPLLFLGGGVDIFFVISGFIMWYTTVDHNIGPREFLQHRFIRIVPLYWVITTFYVVILIVQPTLFQSSRFQLSHVVASYLFIPAIHPVAQEMWPVVVPGWTLNYEMFFYLLFAVAMVALGGLRALVVIASLACVVGLQGLAPPRDSVIGFYSSSIILEFALGVGIGYLYTSGLSIPRLYAAIMLFGGLIGLFLNLETGLMNLPRFFAIGIPACLIVAGAVFYERANGVTEIAFPMLLGDASYSLYLSHGATLSAFEQLWRRMGGPSVSNPTYLFLFSATAIIVATLVGIGVYRVVEQPMIRKMSSWRRRATTVAA